MNTDHYQEALDRLKRLIDEARHRGAAEADAAALATADTNARPSIRMISVLKVEPEGLLFFANERSGKGRQLLANPQASLCFYWPTLQEQVIVEGAIEIQSPEVSDIYWSKCARDFQLAAWAAEQGTQLDKKGETRERAALQKEQLGADAIQRHGSWSAFRILPDRIEFWPSGWHRMRERIRYLRDDAGVWSAEIVSP